VIVFVNLCVLADHLLERTVDVSAASCVEVGLIFGVIRLKLLDFVFLFHYVIVLVIVLIILLKFNKLIFDSLFILFSISIFVNYMIWNL
jgi:hypothetical protein